MGPTDSNRAVWWGSIVAAILFFSWAYFQRNDPDVALWASIYGLAGLFCILYLVDRLAPPVAGVFALVMGIATVYLATLVIGRQPLFTEQAREMWGGLITTVWMTVLYRSGRPIDPDREG